MTFTEEQKRVIFQEGSVVVSAGAGSGKTTVMIERIAQKIKRGASLDEMLIVTFTRAAAADIRVKLSKRLYELRREGEELVRAGLAEEGAALAAKAEDALAAMPVCNIGTLHSFCQKLVRAYYYAAGLDPAATLADEAETQAIKTACVKAAIEELADDAELSVMLGVLSARRGERAAETVESIVDHALSTDDPDGYLSADKPDSEYFAELDRMADRRRARLVRRGEEIRARAEEVGLHAVATVAGEVFDYLDGKIDAFTATRYSAKNDDGDVAAKTEVNDAFKKLKDDCRKLRTKLGEFARAREVESSGYAAALRRAARVALDLFDAKKAALGKIDYSDLEHGARRVLSDDGCLAEIAAAVRYVFIDEYQDVNPLQDAIADSFAALGAELFLVGDVKQSIYGFRRCTPECFMRKCEAAATGGYAHLRLNDNHRSSRAVVEFVNKVFTGLMTEEFGGEDYAHNKLVYAGGGDGGRAEYYVIDDSVRRAEAADGVYSVVNAAEADGADAEAEFVAAKVISYVDRIRRHNADPKNADRRKSLSDIAVLVRSASGAFSDRLTELLSACGIPCNVGKKSKLSDFREAKALVELARCVDTRYDDLALYVALSSPMGGFTDGELAEIAAVGEEQARARKLRPEREGAHGYAFRQKAEAYRDGGLPLSARLKEFYSRREIFARYAGCHDAADSLGYITSKTDFFRHVYETGGGDGGAAAVQAVIAAAEARRGSLHAFIAYCDGDPTLEVAPAADAVSIATIHSSKGLEYEYCIVADAAHSFNMSDVRDRVIVSDRGVAVKYPDAQKGELVPSAPWLAAGGVGAEKIAEEELRLFYVALTRAKTELVVCGKRRKRGDGYVRQTDFMDNIAALAPDIEFAPPVVAPEPSRVDAAVETAVRSICDFDYGARKLFGDGAAGDRVTDKQRAMLKIPLKTCVTAAAAAATDDDDHTSVAPILIEDEERSDRKRVGHADAAARGTAYHRAMELVDFDAPDMDGVKNRCDGFELVDADDILAAAAAMKKLCAGASTVARERYFIADLPRRLVGLPEIGAEKNMLVQGVIDLLIVYPDGTAAIVDYKTTEFSRLDSAAYRTQLELYAAAAERAGGLRVTHTYLYSFGHGLLEFPRADGGE